MLKSGRIVTEVFREVELLQRGYKELELLERGGDVTGTQHFSEQHYNRRTQHFSEQHHYRRTQYFSKQHQ